MTTPFGSFPSLGGKPGPGLIGRVTYIAVTAIVAVGTIGFAFAMRSSDRDALIFSVVSIVLIVGMLIYSVERLTRFTERHGGLATVEGRDAVAVEKLRSKTVGEIAPAPAVPPPDKLTLGEPGGRA